MPKIKVGHRFHPLASFFDYNINRNHGEKQEEDSAAQEGYWKTIGTFIPTGLPKNRAMTHLGRTLQTFLHAQEWREIPFMGNWSKIEEVPIPCPFLFLFDNHAFTALTYQHLASLFPSQVLFLIVLDTHLDIFPNQENSDTVNRGNFLRYLLTEGVIQEDHLLVTPLYDSIPRIQAGLARWGEGLYYLSWDLDFGLPQYAHFPSPLRIAFADLRKIFQVLGHHFRKKGRYLVGMDIVEINLSRLHHPQQLAFQIAILLEGLHPQKIPPFLETRLDRLLQEKYAVRERKRLFSGGCTAWKTAKRC
ncbi:MAG: hypothetical protein ACP5Q4_05030 [Candidatus Caldatribacteriaceae bacterium]